MDWQHLTERARCLIGAPSRNVVVVNPSLLAAAREGRLRTGPWSRLLEPAYVTVTGSPMPGDGSAAAAAVAEMQDVAAEVQPWESLFGRCDPRLTVDWHRYFH